MYAMRECLRAHRRFTGDLNPTSGKIGWVENAQPGYMPQDPQKEFAEKVDLFTWMSEWTGKADDDMIIRGTLGRLLFSGDEDAGTLIFVRMIASSWAGWLRALLN